MPRTAEVVVIGAGITGCSVAYNLATRGQRDIIVLEKDQIGRGSTADAAGGIRLQFSTRANIDLSLASLEVWEHFPERFGVEIGLHQNGYLFLLTQPDEVETFQRNLRLQQSLGVPSRWVEPAEIAALNPAVEVGDLIGGTFCPRDGWADPYSATMGYANAARGLSVTFLQETPATSIRAEGDRVVAVDTPDGSIETRQVIICAGPYSGVVGEMAGIDIPVAPYRRMSFVTEPFAAAPSSVPMTIDFTTSLYFHPESGGFLFGMSNRDEPSSFNKTVDDDWLTRTVEEMVRRAPVFADARIRGGWAGLYEVTPDDNPLLGPVDGVEGVTVAAGFSGHGFMQGPAVGACIAEQLLYGRARTADISAFAPSRFRSGQLAREHNVV